MYRGFQYHFFLATTCPHEVLWVVILYVLHGCGANLFMQIAPQDSMISPLKNIKVLMLASAL
jgi:hypothetical protein